MCAVLVALVMSFTASDGITIGSLNWQPVIFGGTERRFRFVGDAKIRRRCFAIGSVRSGREGASAIAARNRVLSDVGYCQPLESLH